MLDGCGASLMNKRFGTDSVLPKSPPYDDADDRLLATPPKLLLLLINASNGFVGGGAEGLAASGTEVDSGTLSIAVDARESSHKSGTEPDL